MHSNLSKILIKIWLQLFAWAAVSFIVWYLLVRDVLIAVLMHSNRLWLEPLYADIGLKVRYLDKDGHYIADTLLFKASYPYNNGTYLPNLQLAGITEIDLSNLNVITLVYPLLWSLFLLLDKKALKKILQGTLFMTPLVLLSLGLATIMSINETILSEKMLRILQPNGLIFVPQLPPEWCLIVQKSLRDGITYFTLLVAPLLIATILCRNQIVALVLMVRLSRLGP